MGVLQRFERRLEGLVSGAFARAFRSEVKPVEIAAALQRELDNTAQVLTRTRSMVPNVFTVELSPSDHERLRPYSTALSAELTELVADHATSQHYQFTGPVAVDLVERDDLRTGTFQVLSQVRAAVAAAPPRSSPSVRRPVAVVEVNGVEHPVPAPGLVLGRSSDADLRIDDPGVSRRHAELRVLDEGPPPRLSIVDLGSTNGVVVDGRRVATAELLDGSRVTLGSTVVTVRQIAGGGRV